MIIQNMRMWVVNIWIPILFHVHRGVWRNYPPLNNQMWRRHRGVVYVVTLFRPCPLHLRIWIHLQPGRTSYRRSLQPSIENIQHFKTWKFFTFFHICGSFCPPGSGSGSAFKMWIRIRISKIILSGFSESGSETRVVDPDSHGSALICVIGSG